MNFPATYQEFEDYVLKMSDTENSDGAKINFTHDGQGNSAEPWYIVSISREEIKKKGSTWVRTPFATEMVFTSARLGEFNETEVMPAYECRLTPESVRKACVDLNIPIPDLDLQPRTIASPDLITADRRVETIDPVTEKTTKVEFFDGTTGTLVQRETIEADGSVGLLETFDKDTGDALNSVVDPEPGEGRVDGE